MNLNRFKKGFTRTNPERGLRSLPGAAKADRKDRNNSPGTIRVKGRYILSSTDRVGRFCGMVSYICSWLYAALLPYSIFATNTFELTPLAVFIIGFAIIHGCAMAADGLRYYGSPWAQRGIKIFWLTTLVFSIYGIVASIVG